MKWLDAHKNAVIIKLCCDHQVKELYFFGSVLTDKFNHTSDIDVLVQFDYVDAISYFDNYMDLKDKLEFLFLRKIDLVENHGIKNPVFRKVVDREKQLIYERKKT